jgi:hypothetical protein
VEDDDAGAAAELGRDDPLGAPVVANPPKVKLASPNGSVGGTRIDPSLPLTTAITVLTPGPGRRTVSSTPSPLKSPVAARTSPANPGKTVAGVVAVGGLAYWPAAPGAYSAAVPVAAPETASTRPSGIGGGGGGGTGLICSITTGEVLGENEKSPWVNPLYLAVIEWLPTDSDEVMNWAEPLVSGAAGPSGLPPSRKVTVPIGVFDPAAPAVTTAASVTICPATDGLGEVALMVVAVAGGWNS